MEDLTGLARRLRQSAGNVQQSAIVDAPGPDIAVSAPPAPTSLRSRVYRPPPSPAIARGVSPGPSEMSIRQRSPSPRPSPPARVLPPPAPPPLVRRPGGLVVPAIFGVGAAIGTIHFGAAAFPNLFKGRDGKVDRNKVNVGGIVAGALVFLIARYMLSS
eukprot:jgi/Mesvir1/26264/Mv01627-RA.1